MTYTRLALMVVVTAVLAHTSLSQDSVDVTFRYSPPPGAAGVSVPGEFNGWNNTAWPMTNIGGNVYIRTARLRLGGNPNPPPVGIPGAWQYKFYYSGVTTWPNDPLNHHVNPSDNDNSFVIVKDPTIYHFLPNQRQPVVSTSTPTITAYIFPKIGASVDTSTISLSINGTLHSNLGSFYDAAAKRLSYPVQTPLQNGLQTVILSAGSTAGGTTLDTVSFTIQAGYVQITSKGGFTTVNPNRLIRGLVQDTTVTSVRLVRNGLDTTTVPVTGGRYSAVRTLEEGPNAFKAIADSAGSTAISQEVIWTLWVNHTPTARVVAIDGGTTVTLDASSSTDPDGQTLTDFRWYDDPAYPLGLAGVTGVMAVVNKPTAPGEYYFGLVVRDPDGNADTTRAYFIVTPGDSIRNPTYASNPDWAQKARVYFLFPKAASSAGTLNAAALRLPIIKDMGFNVIWMMPVMVNAFPINNGIGPGYNIIDFYNVAPEYGTNQDFRNFVAQAHALGMKVILDVTPNHTSRFHPWAADARTFGEDSRYWNWYQHQFIPHNTNGLGQSQDSYGFWYYSGFSDQLLNFNWTDPDAQREMINVYSYWIKEFGLDGYRFDVYWGPHRRYGEQFMGQPVREALKHIKPDILLLAEDDGTGSGTEVIYADYMSGGVRGGVDAAYDFKLYFNQIRNYYSSGTINNLHNEIDNGGYYPGENALYMRFMESQDEDRIVYFYSNNFQVDPITTFRRTMPMASVLFTAPGFPMIWNGQEVGWGYGISGPKEARSRSVINWDYQGKDLLMPHYQRIAHVRAQFSAFTQHKLDTNNDGVVTGADEPDFVRIPTHQTSMYAFSRPWLDQNGLTLVNLSAVEQMARIDLTVASGVKFTGGIQPGTLYYLNNLYTNTSQLIPGSQLDSVFVTLQPYGTAIFTVSATLDSVIILNPFVDAREVPELPAEFALEQNYPNPFNPATSIRISIPRSSPVVLKVYDILGREITTLIDREMTAGLYTVVWDGMNSAGAAVGSGVYFYRLTADRSVPGEGPSQPHVLVKKMVLVR